MKKLFSVDPLTGTKTTFEADPLKPGAFTLHTEVDIESIVEENKRRQNDGTGGWSKSKEWRHAASIPFIMLVKWAEEAGVDMNSPAMSEIIKKKMNDPDFRLFRTATFRV